MIIGIDVGGSTTKIVGLEQGRVISPLMVTAADPVTSLFGAFGKFLHDNSLALHDVERVMLTGVGCSRVETPIYGLPTQIVDEFQADGLGAQHLTGLHRVIVVSMGTGTTLVKCDGNDISHLGGISMGGGTLQGLSHLLLNTDNIGHVLSLAAHGDVSVVNLLIGDITTHEIEGLPPHATASLFGKVVRSEAGEADVAIGLIVMVLETIGSCAVLSRKGCGIDDFALIGNLTRLPQCKIVFPLIEQLYGVRFHTPEHAAFATAVGAALAGEK